jgi:hypothetical protein
MVMARELIFLLVINECRTIFIKTSHNHIMKFVPNFMLQCIYISETLYANLAYPDDYTSILLEWASIKEGSYPTYKIKYTVIENIYVLHCEN